MPSNVCPIFCAPLHPKQGADTEKQNKTKGVLTCTFSEGWSF